MSSSRRLRGVPQKHPVKTRPADVKSQSVAHEVVELKGLAALSRIPERQRLQAGHLFHSVKCLEGALQATPLKAPTLRGSRIRLKRFGFVNPSNQKYTLSPCRVVSVTKSCLAARFRWVPYIRDLWPTSSP